MMSGEGRRYFIFLVFLGYVFIASGLVVNLLMLVSCVIWPFSKKLYRTINMYLAYSHWINFTFWGQWWSRSDIEIVMDEQTDDRLFGKEHAVVILNHKYDIDWLMGWLLAERYQALGGSKIYGKQMLKYVPLIGWAWYFTESIFLRRDWAQDKRHMIESLLKFSEFPYPVWILLFCEGTRFTESKHQKSLEYAWKNGLTPLKHHLLPRTKGFVLSVQALKGKVPAIYDCVIGFKTDAAVPTLKSILQGKTCRAEMSIRRIPLDEVPTDDEQCAKWLYKLYERKDATYETFIEKGTFDGRHVKVPRRLNDLVMWLFWAASLSVPLVYIVYVIFFRSPLWIRAAAVVVFVFLLLLVRWMIHVARVDRGADFSLKYGQNKKRS